MLEGAFCKTLLNVNSTDDRNEVLCDILKKDSSTHAKDTKLPVFVVSLVSNSAVCLK